MSITYPALIHEDRAEISLSYAELQDIRHAAYLGVQYATHVTHDKASEKHCWDVYNGLGVVAQGLLRPHYVEPETLVQAQQFQTAEKVDLSPILIASWDEVGRAIDRYLDTPLFGGWEQTYEREGSLRDCGA